MQIYAARAKEGRWERHLLTNWSKPVVFSGRGTMGFIGISISQLSRTEPGILTMTYRHRDYGSGRLVVDEKTLRPQKRPKKQINIVPDFPGELNHVESDFQGMSIRRANDTGNSRSANVCYILQWETLGKNRDRPRKPPLPQPSMLRLYKLIAND
jgi:hypothetical protein